VRHTKTPEGMHTSLDSPFEVPKMRRHAEYATESRGGVVSHETAFP